MNSYVRILGERARSAAKPLWLPRPEIHRSRFGGILLVPTAAYHVEELVPVGHELRRLGYRVTFITTRVAPRQVLLAMKSWKGPLFAWPRKFTLVPPFQAVVVMNDWGPTRNIVALAKQRGVPSFAKVEGVQDFEDVDTNRVRRPYQHVDIVLAQGRKDVESLPRSNVHVVGSERLSHLWKQAERAVWNNPPRAIINSNFTYGVLSEQRDRWLQQAVDAVLAAGCLPIISQHPADCALGDAPYVAPYATRTSMSSLLSEGGDLLISRFSTVPFEAMARGVPFVYFNPHYEKVPTFQTQTNAFLTAHTGNALEQAIRESLLWRGTYRSRCVQFFENHVDFRIDSPSRRTANLIANNLFVVKAC